MIHRSSAYETDAFVRLSYCGIGMPYKSREKQREAGRRNGKSPKGLLRNRRTKMRRARQLSMPFATAVYRLYKMILFNLVVKAGLNTCFRCGTRIEKVSDLSIEHKDPWQQAADPRAAFFDLDNITFSHLLCNSRGSKYEMDALAD